VPVNLCLQVVEEFAAATGAGLTEELGHTLTDRDSSFLLHLAAGRLHLQSAHMHHALTLAVPGDLCLQVVEEFAAAMGAGLDEELGHTLTDLDGRFATVRTRESNLCNLLGDVFRRACSADVCILNSGTFRYHNQSLNCTSH
jgi:hypothetical protein